MRRNPSIHITKLTLKKLFDYFEINTSIDTFMVKAKALEVNRRYYLVKSNSTSKKATELTDEINTTLYKLRKDKKHYGVKLYNERDKEFAKIKVIGKHIIDFQKTFNLKRSEVVSLYFNLYFEILGGKTFSLLNLIQSYEHIYSKYSEILEVTEYQNKKLALDCLAIYCYLQDVNQKPTFESNKLAFVRCAKQIEETNSDPIDWIKAQIEYFNSYKLNITPNILYGDKALRRYKQVKRTDNTILRKKIFGI